jgi:hypothetical protein
LYNDGEGATWQPRENFEDSNGDINDIFLSFEEKESEVDPNDALSTSIPKTPLKRTLSEASLAIYSHTSTLSDQSVSSTEIGTAEEMSQLSKKIKKETKKDIRASTISKREEEKNEISKHMKAQLVSQEQCTNFNQIMQLHSMKLLNQLVQPESNSNATQIVEIQKEVGSIKGDIDEIKSSMAQILALFSKNS